MFKITPKNVLTFLENPNLVGEYFELAEFDLIEFFASRTPDEVEMARWTSHVNGMLAMLDALYFDNNNILGLTKTQYVILKESIKFHDIGKSLMKELFSFKDRYNKFQHAVKDLHASVGKAYLANHTYLIPENFRAEILRTIAEHHSVSKNYLSQVIKEIDEFQALMARDASRSYQDPDVANFAKDIVFNREKGKHNEKIMNLFFDLYKNGKLPIIAQEKANA